MAHRRERERERERERTQGGEYLFLGIYLIHLIQRKFWMGFLPLEGFPGLIPCLYCDFVSFSDFA